MLSVINRNETYKNIIEKLPNSRKVVYEVIYQLGYSSLDEVCFNLNKTKNELSGRITELKYFGLIKEVSDGISSRSNNKVTVYSCTTQEERISIVNKRYISLIEEQKKLESDFIEGISIFTLDLIKKRISSIKKKINQLSKFA